MARAVRIKLHDEDFARLLKGEVVTKEERTVGSGRPGSKPLDVTVFIALDDIGFDRMRELLTLAVRESVGE